MLDLYDMQGPIIMTRQLKVIKNDLIWIRLHHILRKVPMALCCKAVETRRFCVIISSSLQPTASGHEWLCRRVAETW